jgi:predicted PolB exonuclease-like 3'-5' exonuclease
MSDPSMHFRSTQDRRVVVLDIETVAVDANTSRGALDAMSGRVVCMGLLVDDGLRLQEIAIAAEDEIQILKEFWNTIRPSDLMVGHNVIDFDLNFIRQRSWILNVRPTRSFDMRRYYTTEVKDTLQMWTNWGFKKGVTLDALGTALNCGGKTGHGADVAELWAERDLESIKAYCMNDVRVTYAIYCRLSYQPPRAAKYQTQNVLDKPGRGVQPRNRNCRLPSPLFPIKKV